MKKIIISIIILFSLQMFPALSYSGTQGPTNSTILSYLASANISWKNPENDAFLKTILFKSQIPIYEYFSYRAVEEISDKIYEGKNESFLDKDLIPNLSYYYILFSLDKNGKYSKAVVLEKVITKNKNEGEPQKNSTNPIAASGETLAGLNSEAVNEVSFKEAEIIYDYNQKTEQEIDENSNRLALFILIKSPHSLTDNEKNSISYFIRSGTPTTIVLGSGERAGVLNSYLSVFNKLPRNILEWQDIIKISNGRWPNERRIDSEEKASDEYFKVIYQRDPNMNNTNDNAAVTVIAYGLRPGKRNFSAEKNAINIYKNIFKKNPTEAIDWDLVRAIAYSGASR